MNVLKGKCLVASEFSPGLLLVLVFVGSAFIPAKPKENFVPIDLVDINAMVVDEPNVVGGGKPNASLPPASTPKTQPQPRIPQPTPPAPIPKQEPKPEPIKPKEPTAAEKIPEVKPETKRQIDPESFNLDKIKEKPVKTPPNFDLSKAEKRVIKPSASSAKESSNAENEARAERETKMAQARAGALSEVMSRLQGG